MEVDTHNIADLEKSFEKDYNFQIAKSLLSFHIKGYNYTQIIKVYNQLLVNHNHLDNFDVLMIIKAYREIGLISVSIDWTIKLLQITTTLQVADKSEQLSVIESEFSLNLLEYHEIKSAMILMNKYDSQDSNPHWRLVFATYYIKKGLYTHALSILLNLLKLNTNLEVDIKVLLLECFYHLERFSDFYPLVEELYLLYPRHTRIALWKAKALNIQSKHTEADSIFLVIQKEHYPSYLLSMEWGKATLEAKKHRLSKIYFENAKKMASWNEDVNGLQAILLAKYYPHEFNIENLINLSSSNENINIYFYIGYIYKDIYGNLEKGIEFFNKSAQARPEHIATKIHLADCYELINMFKQAKDLYLEILQLSPNHPIATKKLENYNFNVSS